MSKLPVNKRAAVAAWQLAMYRNDIERALSLVSNASPEDRQEAKTQLFRLFYGIIYPFVIDGPTDDTSDLEEMLTHLPKDEK